MKEGTIFIVIVFPKPWPPRDRFEILRQEKDGSIVAISADKEGCISLETESDGTSMISRFQPIKINGFGKVILSAKWGANLASIQLNGTEVQLENDSEGQMFTLNVKNDELHNQNTVIGNIDLEAGYKDSEYLFLSTLADIDKKIQDGSKYSLIRAAGMLRQLFLDGKSSLLHPVNRNYRLKIEFRTNDYTTRPPLIPNVDLIDLDPSHLSTSKILSISLDCFMKAPCIFLNETTISVHDIIKLCANSKGGIHFDNPKSEAEKNAHEMDQLFRLCGQEPSIKLLKGICRISLMGLKQLVDDITKKT